MFEHLESFAYILVTGPQRSGTQICAAMIAHDLPTHELVTEKDLGAVDSLNDLLGKMAADTNLVVQCPALARWAHFLGARDDVCIVWMRRDTEEVVASQVRVNWSGGVAELIRYAFFDAWHFTPRSDRVAIVKTTFFGLYQRGAIRHVLMVQYRDLQSHPLWVPDDLRCNFGAHQIKID